ncbi:exported hypothetical protein [Candidatus Zixiibacteriota bacterium]|nr:exported hypothetical protein [candidate division Zixibacteria bacterium]
MRVTRSLIILFALILFVICFNAPAVFSGDEHPWDGEGGSTHPGSTGIPGTDSTKIIVRTSTYTSSGGNSGTPGISWAALYSHVIIYANFITWYRDLPADWSLRTRGVEENVRSISTVIMR